MRQTMRLDELVRVASAHRPERPQTARLALARLPEGWRLCYELRDAPGGAWRVLGWVADTGGNLDPAGLALEVAAAIRAAGGPGLALVLEDRRPTAVVV